MPRRAIYTHGRWLLLLTFFFLPSCRSASGPPLSDPDDAKPDERLFGAWNLLHEKDPSSVVCIFLIGKSGLQQAPTGILKTQDVGADRAGEVKVGEPFFFFTTVLGDNHYANLCDLKGLEGDKWDKAQIKECALIKYAVDGEQLTIWTVDVGAAETAIKMGMLRGKIIETGDLKLKSVVFQDADNLRTYLQNGGDQLLFPDKHPVALRRIR